MIRTAFIARDYLSDPGLRTEIQEGLNVIENWNSANKDIFSGKSGELTGKDKESVEVSALALHLVQAAIGIPQHRPDPDRAGRPRLARAVRPVLDPPLPMGASRSISTGTSTCGW